jgi:hypothetical protein
LAGELAGVPAQSLARVPVARVVTLPSRPASRPRSHFTPNFPPWFRQVLQHQGGLANCLCGTPLHEDLESRLWSHLGTRPKRAVSSHCLCPGHDFRHRRRAVRPVWPSWPHPQRGGPRWGQGHGTACLWALRWKPRRPEPDAFCNGAGHHDRWQACALPSLGQPHPCVCHGFFCAMDVASQRCSSGAGNLPLHPHPHPPLCPADCAAIGTACGPQVPSPRTCRPLRPPRWARGRAPPRSSSPPSPRCAPSATCLWSLPQHRACIATRARWDHAQLYTVVVWLLPGAQV